MAVSLEQFLDRIADSGLMSRAEVRGLVDSEAAADQPTDGQQLARLLVRLKKLTAFQAQLVYSGQGKSLILGNYVVLDHAGLCRSAGMYR